MPHLGIDWGVEKHDLCLLADDGRILSELSIPSGNGSFRALHKLLDGLNEVTINVERPVVCWSTGWQRERTPST